jgi:hypothetical protein
VLRLWRRGVTVHKVSANAYFDAIAPRRAIKDDLMGKHRYPSLFLKAIGDELGFDAIFSIESTSNEKTSNFTRTSTDLVEFGITHETTRRIIVDVTIATQYLNTIKTELRCFLGTVQDDTSAVLEWVDGSAHISL